LPLVINVDLPIVAQDYVHRIGRTGRAGASGVAVSLVCADEAPQLAAIEALIRQTLPREEEPGFEAEHRVPQTSATGQIVKKPKKPKKPKVLQVATGAAQVPSKNTRSKPAGKPASKPATGSRKPTERAGGRGKRQR
jgi:superfamily II DNA/RNA helicase